MTVTINGPNGVTVNFPDGTDSATINTVMSHATGLSAPKAEEAHPAMKIGLGDVGMAALRGIPIAGGMIESMSSPESQSRYKQFDQEHPWLSGGAGAVGGVASMAVPLGLPGKAGTLAAKAYGLTGETLAKQTVNSALSGGAIGGLDALTRGNDVGSGAGVGSALGAAAPLVGRGIGAIASPVVETIRGIRNPAGVAARGVNEAITRDLRAGNAGMAPAEFSAAESAGLPVTNLERGGEMTRALARSAANTSPEGRAVLDNAINPRFEGQAERLNKFLDDQHHFPNATAQQAALSDAAKATNNPAYAKAYQEGSRGLWSPELERLAGADSVSTAMQAAAKNAKDEAIIGGFGAMNPRISFTPDGRMQFAKGPSGVPTYPDLQYWDLVRRELSDAARKATPGTSEARRLTNFAGSMNAELDKLVPSYQAARSGAAHFFGAKDALEAGQKFVTDKFNNGEVRMAVAKMSPTEKQLFEDGYVSRLKETINSVGDRRSVLNRIASSPIEREKAIIALGPEKANQLFSRLRQEGVMDRARPAIQGNSTTARQLAELGLAGGVYGIGTGLDPTNPNPGAIASAALTYGALKGKGAINANVSRQVAELLASSRLPASGIPPRLLAGLRGSDIPSAQVLSTLGARALSGGVLGTRQ